MIQKMVEVTYLSYVINNEPYFDTIWTPDYWIDEDGYHVYFRDIEVKNGEIVRDTRELIDPDLIWNIEEIFVHKYIEGD